MRCRQMRDIFTPLATFTSLPPSVATPLMTVGLASKEGGGTMKQGV